MNSLGQDLRYAFRLLLKSPGFTAVAVISLALGIGANTAIFSVVNSVLLKSLPFHDPEKIVLLWGDEKAEGNHRSQVSFTDMDDWRAQNHVFEEVATYHDWRPILSGAGEAERIDALQVSDGYFSVMKGKPLLGRTFLPEEQLTGKDFEIILGYGLWQRYFQGNPAIVGRTISLNSRTYTVVGVMPADFQSLPTTLIERPAQLYRPLAEQHDEEERSSRHLRAIARLKPNAGVRQAQAEMDVIARKIEQEHPNNNHGYGVRVVSLADDTVGGLRSTLLLLFGAVAFVLLIACANVGNLLLARAVTRQKEITIRAAMGAARWRLIRQFLTESILLALLGGALGLLIAVWGVKLIEALGARVFPMLGSIEINPTVLAFTMAASVLTGVVFGLAPAWHVSKPDLTEALKDGGKNATGSSGGNRLRGVLVVAEVALALVLLVSAGLIIKSVMRLRDVNPGFDTRNTLTMELSLPGAKYPNPPDWINFFDRVIDGAARLPGVKAAGGVSVLPLGANFDGRTIQVEGQPKPPGEDPNVDLYIVTPGYLQAMSIGLKKGRLFDNHDIRGADVAQNVALINETMAQRFWPNDDPIGKRIKFPGGPSNPQPWRTIVGVVNDVKQYGLDTKSPGQMYLPQTQYPTNQMALVVKTTNDPSALVGALRGQVLSIDKDQAVYNVATMDQVLAESIARRRFIMLLLAVFAGVALILAAFGIYSVMSYSVSQRTHEIGIRLALGAQTTDVVGLVMKQGLGLSLAGVAIGLVIAIGVTRVMASLLFDVSPTDGLTLAVVSILLIGVAVIASFVPARRAIRLDPMIALRSN